METKYVAVNGIRTRYLEAGSGEPLLLVHGGDFGRYCSGNDWDTNIADLARYFHVLAIDKVGCGFTDNPGTDKEYVIGTTVDHAHNFLKTLGIKSAHAAGHSRGGYTVCRLSLEHPESVKTLIIVDSGTLMTSAITVYEEWDKQLANIKDIKEKNRYIVTANSFSARHVTEEFLELMTKVSLLPKSLEAAEKMSARLKIPFEHDLLIKRRETHRWIRAGRLKAPTLIMWGFNDPSAKLFPSGIAALRLIFNAVPRSEMHILNRAGHYCFREQPGAFNAAVINFIKSA
ncbi:MAG: alpha/beta hydrolase [Chloroflexi bacterium]|nr:alpha/beta hydrolase [Chloroflexota bacterium]